jgi:hypothetical protein
MFGSPRLLRRPETLTATSSCLVRGRLDQVWDALVEPGTPLDEDIIETGWMPGSPHGLGGRQYSVIRDDGKTIVTVLEVVEFVPQRKASVVFVSSWLYSGYRVSVEDIGAGQCAVAHEFWLVLPAGVPATWIDSHQQHLVKGAEQLSSRLPAALEADIAGSGG